MGGDALLGLCKPSTTILDASLLYFHLRCILKCLHLESPPEMNAISEDTLTAVRLCASYAPFSPVKACGKKLQMSPEE